jgi:hypothetical protein
MCQRVSEEQQLGMFLINGARVQNFLEPGEDVFMVSRIIFDQEARKYGVFATHKKLRPR